MVVGVIPARIGSKRFPKKILADINGKPMIAHVAERAKQSKLLDKIIVAIDSEETNHVLSDFDFELVMTSEEHSSGTDRVPQITKEIDEDDVVINIQRDEPFLNPRFIDGIIQLIVDPTV